MVLLLPKMTRSVAPKQVHWAPLKTFSADNLALISTQLQVLSDRLLGIMILSPPVDVDPLTPWLLSSLSPEKVVWLVHCPDSALPPICPCERDCFGKMRVLMLGVSAVIVTRNFREDNLGSPY